MAYRANPTDKQQADIERAENDSAIRVFWWDGDDNPKVLNLRAYDGKPGSDAAGSPVGDVVMAGKVIGSHNDHPGRFANPGKA